MSILERIVHWIRRLGGLETKDCVTTHDYTIPEVDHEVTVTRVLDGGYRLFVSGEGKGVKDSDFILLWDKSLDRVTRYKVGKVVYHRNPPTRWTAELNFYPREW